MAFCLSAINAYPSHSQHLQHIPVPGYNPKIQLLGQHVDLHEIPTKIVKITKTVAIKIPVPYPVKIPHNVPYPVHVNKPYPVPVPQIIKVPHPVPVPVSSGHHDSGLGHGGGDGGHFDTSSHFQNQAPSYGGHHELSSGGFGGGFESSGHGGGEQYGGESQQVQSPIAYHHQSDSGPTSYQTQEISSYHGSAPQSYSIDVDHGSYAQQKLGQDSYQQHSEASEQKIAYQPSNAGYQHAGHMYQVEAPGQSSQYGFKNQGY